MGFKGRETLASEVGGAPFPLKIPCIMTKIVIMSFKKKFIIRRVCMIDSSRFDKTLGCNIPQSLRSRVQRHPEFTLLASKNKNGVFIRYSYIQIYQQITELAAAFKKMGIKRGDHIGMISDNRKEWFITDYALLSLGAADVPRGCDSMGVEIRFILNYAECAVSIFENGRQLEKVLEKPEEVPFLKTAILYDPAPVETVERARNAGITVIDFSHIQADGMNASAEELKEIESEIDETKGDEIATIIFTSGTTGTPKGVMLTHDNFLAQSEVVHLILQTHKPGDLWLTVLPIWHVFERAFNYMIIALSGGIAFSKPVASVMMADMAAIHPNWMCAVPRLWEAFAQGIDRQMKKKSPLEYTIYRNSVEIGKLWYRNFELLTGRRCRYHWYPRFLDVLRGLIPFILLSPLYGIGELLVYRKIREKLGGRFTAAISGGGALQSKTDAFYHAIGFNLLEGYGMTETAPVISVKNAKCPRSNCVGPIFPSFELKIVDVQDGKPASSEPLKPGKRGLVLVRGRQIMKGYYKRPDLTAATIDEEGWLNTGDLGMLSIDKELKLTGRAKDTIVLLGGENIEPQVVEKAIKNSHYVESVCLVGQDQKYVGALIVPSKDAVLQYAEDNHIVFDFWEDLLETNEIQSLFRSEIDMQVNAKNGFRTCERVFRFALLEESFKIGEEINAKQEMVRNKIAQIHKREIAELFKS